MRKGTAYLTIFLSYGIGGGSLVIFFVFLYAGHLNLIRFGLAEGQALLLDAGLSLLFFLQHSGMVRQGFQKFQGRFFPQAYGAAVYAIASGVVLLGVLLFWQGTAGGYSLEGAARIAVRVIFFLPLVGFFWSVRALGNFDTLGIGGVLADLRGRKPRLSPFTVAGPYRLVRHPLYLLVLVMIWSCPDLTRDRLLFNLLWSLWIVVGTLWEECDLVRVFGEDYRDYQRRVPMLLPVRFIRGLRDPMGDRRQTQAPAEEDRRAGAGAAPHDEPGEKAHPKEKG
jgi:protein-S-isoprenylcysteine O-methyltransferase Ste14